MVYSVYKHIFPNNKVYIGITVQKPERRWRKDGSGYLRIRNGKLGQPLIWKAIQKYGWENVQHKILNEVKTKEEAERLERYYITEVYHSNETDKGYNIQNGGNYRGTLSEETKEKLRQANLGRKMSLETRLKMSKSGKGKKLTLSHCKHLSEVQKGGSWYNNGQINIKIRKGQVPPEGFIKGIFKSEKYKQNRSKITKGTKYYNNGKINIRLKDNQQIPEGFIRGRIMKKNIGDKS